MIETLFRGAARDRREEALKVSRRKTLLARRISRTRRASRNARRRFCTGSKRSKESRR